jgi:hypothetical protein
MLLRHGRILFSHHCICDFKKYFNLNGRKLKKKLKLSHRKLLMPQKKVAFKMPKTLFEDTCSKM